MRKLIIGIFFLISSAICYSESLNDGLEAEKRSIAFEAQMKKGENKAKDVVNFIEKLKKDNKKNNAYDLFVFIMTMEFVNYKEFDIKKCKAYRNTLLIRSSSPNEELTSESIGLYAYHALRILSKVCNDPSLNKFVYIIK